MSPFTQIAVSQLLCEEFLPKFHRNDGNIARNRNIISADLENLGQGHHLKKSYIDSYAINFNQNDAIEAGSKSITSTDLENVTQGHISQRLISQLLSNRFEPNVLHV